MFAPSPGSGDDLPRCPGPIADFFVTAFNERSSKVIAVDKNAASPKALADLKVVGILPDSAELRQVKSSNG
jgi:hypothetical protein